MLDVHFSPLQCNIHDFFPRALDIAEQKYLASSEIDVSKIDARTQNEDWLRLVAIRLLLGKSTLTDDMYLACCDENLRNVLEDPFLRAWVVGSYCSDMIAELELQQEVEFAFSYGGSPSIEAQITDFENLRYYAAWTIAEGNGERAVALLPEFSNVAPPQSSLLLPEILF